MRDVKPDRRGDDPGVVKLSNLEPNRRVNPFDFGADLVPLRAEVDPMAGDLVRIVIPKRREHFALLTPAVGEENPPVLLDVGFR
jgi:hypothetical protein